MSGRNLLFESLRMGFAIGRVLALYISLSMFWQMPYSLWLTINNLLVGASLFLAAFVGYKALANQASFKFMLLAIAVFFFVVMLFHVGSYVLTTTFFADKMVWIPFFYRDFTYHGFTSVSDYLNHNDNFHELLELQVISLLIASVLYFTLGILGYGAAEVTILKQIPTAQ